MYGPAKRGEGLRTTFVWLLYNMGPGNGEWKGILRAVPTHAVDNTAYTLKNKFAVIF